jgi:hypothetical protein
VDQFVDCKDNRLKIICFRTAGQRITVHRTYTSLISLVNFYLEEDYACDIVPGSQNNQKYPMKFPDGYSDVRILVLIQENLIMRDNGIFRFSPCS